MKRLVPIAVAALAASACGRETPPLAVSGGIAVLEAYATASAAPDVSALYFTVENRTPGADTLIAVSTSVGQATLHTVETRDGLSSMQPVERLAVPGRTAVRMRPGSFHVMLSALPSPLVAGDSIDVEARFVHAGTLRFPAPVMTYSDVVERLEQGEAGRR